MEELVIVVAKAVMEEDLVKQAAVKELVVVEEVLVEVEDMLTRVETVLADMEADAVLEDVQMDKSKQE
eukprot:Em0001g219a